MSGAMRPMRGPSVRERTSRYEQAMPGSTQWMNSQYTGGGTPTKLGGPSRDPVYGSPSGPGPGAPRTAAMYASDYESPGQRGGPGGGGGAARKMIQQWETSSPGQLQPPPHNQLRHQSSRDSIYDKPLPRPQTIPHSTTPPYAPAGGRSPYTMQNTPPGPSRLPPAASPSRPPFQQSPSHLNQVSPIRGPAYSPGRGGMAQSPSRVSFAPSPNKHLQTPNRGRDNSRDGSPSNWSGSPNEKKRKGGGKSPLKEMFSAIGKKAKGKGKEKRDSYGNGYDITMDGGLKRVGSNGLPGGIVFRDRMGDQEMDPREVERRDVVRQSSVIYLVPTPCSSVSPWGSWFTSWAILTANALQIIYCPIFQEPANRESPRRMMDPNAPVPYQAIPAPDPYQRPDVELDMRECVEVRSLRKEEVGGRGVPEPPDGVGSEVLEMVWADGSRRYVGVEGVSGRIGWVSAIWDVLLACKSETGHVMPPPSPSGTLRPLPDQPGGLCIDTGNTREQNPGQPLDEPSPFRQHHQPAESSPLRQYEYHESVVGESTNSSVPTVQKVGDRWVAAGAIGKVSSEVSDNYRRLQGTPEALRNSVQQMFESPTTGQGDFPDSQAGQDRARLYMATSKPTYLDEDEGSDDESIVPPRVESPTPDHRRFDSSATLGVGFKGSREATERILAWQPQTERELSIFARSPSRASNRSNSKRKVLSELDRDNSFMTAHSGETDLSFDPSDLNPSRSASQVGRPKETPRRRGSKPSTVLPPVDENTTPTQEREIHFSSRPDKTPSSVVKEFPTKDKSTVSRRAKEFEDRQMENGLSPMAMRTFNQIAGKEAEEQRPRSRAADPVSPTRDDRRGSRSSGLPRGVEMLSPRTNSSETAESATVRTPHMQHQDEAKIRGRSDDTHDSQQNEVDQDGDIRMGEHPGAGSGGALSKLLPAYSDLSQPEAAYLPREKTQDKGFTSSEATTQVSLGAKDLQKVISTLNTLVGASQALDDPATLPKGLGDRFDTIQLDVKAIENALNISALRLPNENAGTGPNEDLSVLPEMHAKLDAIQRLCEDVLARQEIAVKASDSAKSSGSKPTGLGLSLEDDERSAGDEVAQIMADLTGGSNGGTSPARRGGLQVLHNVSAPTSPRPGSEMMSPTLDGTKMISDDVKKQVVEVLALVKELKENRTLQTQQTTDIARYLNELNGWLEKFVQNSAVELTSMSKRLNALVGPNPGDNPDGTDPKRALPDVVNEVHAMLAEQKAKIEAEGPVGQRLDGLLTMMSEERDRQAGQQGMVEQVLAILGRQRSDNEMLLRALATDLTSEIRGERIRFVEAMQQATTMNVTRHVEEFKKTLSAEVQKSIKELGKMRDEKRALETQIADLFAFKAKFGGNNSRRGSVVPQGQMIQAMATAANQMGGNQPVPAGGGGRVLPAPPA